MFLFFAAKPKRAEGAPKARGIVAAHREAGRTKPTQSGGAGMSRQANRE
jgi:hypothetical protein